MKLFVSYLLVILVTVFTVLGFSFHNSYEHVQELVRTESEAIAKESVAIVVRSLAARSEVGVAGQLDELQFETPYKINIVSFRSERLFDSEEPFKLTYKEQALLKTGESLEGEAEGRVSETAARRHHPRGMDPRTSLRPRFVPGFFVARPILFENQCIGEVVVYHSRPDFSARTERAVSAFLQGLFVAFVFSSVFAVLFAGSLTRPIRRMARAAKELAGGDFSVRADLQRGDELGLLAESFDEMAAELEANIERRTRLISDVSHELGNPISTIRATLEAINGGLIGPEDQEQYLTSLTAQVLHLSHLVNDVTELSRFETGEMLIRRDAFRADTPVFEAVDAAIALAKNKNIELLLPSPTCEMRVMGDRKRITQVLKNLIVNAIQHNPEGTIIRTALYQTGKVVRFEISDNGSQISEEDSLRLFDRFFKATESRTQDGSGSGLGLAISKEILTAHDSTLNLTRTEDGKSFTFTLGIAE